MLKVKEITSEMPTTIGWSLEIGITEGNHLLKLRDSVLADLNSKAEGKRRYLTDGEKVEIAQVLCAITDKMCNLGNSFEGYDIRQYLIQPEKK